MLQYLTIVLHYQKNFMTIVNQLPMTALALAIATLLFRSIWASYHASLVPVPIRINSPNIV
jgi:hypothetical protein